MSTYTYTIYELTFRRDSVISNFARSRDTLNCLSISEKGGKETKKFLIFDIFTGKSLLSSSGVSLSGEEEEEEKKEEEEEEGTIRKTGFPQRIVTPVPSKTPP